jgi:hypothetical protein
LNGIKVDQYFASEPKRSRLSYEVSLLLLNPFVQQALQSFISSLYDVSIRCIQKEIGSTGEKYVKYQRQIF